MSGCSSVLSWSLQGSVPPPSVEIYQPSDQDPSQHTNDSTLQSVRRALAASALSEKDMDEIEREFLDALHQELIVTQTDIIAHYSAIGGTYHNLRKRLSNVSLSPSFHSSLTTTTMTTISTARSILYTWDASTVQDCLTSYLLSDPSAWKKLIKHLPTEERLSLIRHIFSNHSEAEVFRYLSGDDAQTFIDVIDEASLHTISLEVCVS